MPTNKGARHSVWRYRKVAGLAPSEFTLQQQVSEWPGDILEVTVSLPAMTRVQASEWIAKLTSLDGVVGTFYWGPDGQQRNTLATTGGTPLVDGGGQSGKSILLKGWSGNLSYGDFIQVQHTDFKRLYMVVKPVAATSAIDIRPAIRTPVPAGDAACSFVSPVGLFRLAEPQEWSIDEAQHYGISFKAIEAL